MLGESDSAASDASFTLPLDVVSEGTEDEDGVCVVGRMVVPVLTVVVCGSSPDPLISSSWDFTAIGGGLFGAGPGAVAFPRSALACNASVTSGGIPVKPAVAEEPLDHVSEVPVGVPSNGPPAGGSARSAPPCGATDVAVVNWSFNVVAVSLLVFPTGVTCASDEAGAEEFSLGSADGAVSLVDASPLVLTTANGFALLWSDRPPSPHVVVSTDSPWTPLANPASVAKVEMCAFTDSLIH